MKGIKGSVDEGGVRVPFFIHWPARLAENQEIEQLGAHIDVLPTLAELCGLDLNETLPLDGISLAPWLIDPERPAEERTLFHIHTEGEDRSFPMAVRTPRYRMVIGRDQKPRLFDMLEDPGQKNDIGPQRPQIRDSLVLVGQNWFQDVSKSGILPPPIPVGFSESLVVRLPAPEAQLEGNVSFKGRMGWANDYATNWQSGDAIAWPLEVESAGTYTLTLLGSADRSVRFDLEVQNERKSILGPKPGPVQRIPSPDRVPRGEVYAYRWNPSEPIEIRLEKGRTELRFRLKGEDAGLQLKEVLLKKI
jgi:arylsulfatase A